MAPPERRAAIIAATIPLLRTRGWMVTTREIATAAGVAEGTIFSVFDDKEALLLAALEEGLNPAVTVERLSQIDQSLPFADQLVMAVEILQARMLETSRLVATLQLEEVRRRLPMSFNSDDHIHSTLASLFEPYRDELRIDPLAAVQALVALTVYGSNPRLFDTPLTSAEVVTIVLGIRAPASELAGEPLLPGVGTTGGV